MSPQTGQPDGGPAGNRHLVNFSPLIDPPPSLLEVGEYSISSVDSNIAKINQN